MGSLYKNGTFVADEWLIVEGEAPVPEGEDVIVPLDKFIEDEHLLLTRNNGRLGVALEAGDDPAILASHFDRIDLIAVDFPSFADGRAFSTARLLREKFGFQGEVRATGDVRVDQVHYMQRSGFNALLITHQPTIDALASGRDPAIELYYQPAIGGGERPGGERAWLRRV